MLEKFKGYFVGDQDGKGKCMGLCGRDKEGRIKLWVTVIERVGVRAWVTVKERVRVLLWGRVMERVRFKL